jgi:starch-binding outer membrane protein, SusD/RagB family
MKFHKIIFAAMLCISIGSCTKVLDKKNLGAVNEQDVWNDMALATAYVNMLHAHNLPSWSTEFADYSEESDGGGNFMYGQLTENSVNYWPYDDIRDINILLNNVDKGSLSAANKKWLKGQAYFFRAWRYFEMVKRYGGVPLILQAQELTDDLFVSRASTSATMQQIIKDLDSAIADLPAVMASSGENNGRVHKGTAHAVKGRVLLYYASPQFDPGQTAAGRWQAAYDANKTAKDFLTSQGFGLFPSFGGLWYNEMNKEVIYVKRYEYTPNIASTFHNWSASTRPLDVSQGATGGNRPTLEIVNAFPMKDGRPITDPASAYPYDPNYFWKNRDPRFRETIVYNGAIWGLGIEGPQTGRIQWNYVGAEQNSPTLTGFYMRKAVDTTQSAIEAFNSSTDWIELRYAEVLLNLAEAANETNKISEAYTELKAIRARAGIDPGSNNLYGLDANMTKEQMRNAIMEERKIEFAFEAKRFWDLRRRRLFESQLNGKKRTGLTIQLKIPRAQFDSIRNSMTPNQFIEHLNQNYTNYFTHTIKVLDTQFPINWKPEYYFFAIPSQHLQLNSNLKQTNGWAGGSFDPLL